MILTPFVAKFVGLDNPQSPPIFLGFFGGHSQNFTFLPAFFIMAPKDY